MSLQTCSQSWEKNINAKAPTSLLNGIRSNTVLTSLGRYWENSNVGTALEQEKKITGFIYNH